MDSDNAYIPLSLDVLLDELVMQQFVFGVDTHLRIARFVAHNHGRNFSVEEWKYRLAALLCHSEDDQKVFYATFDNFVKSQKQFAKEAKKEFDQKQKPQNAPETAQKYPPQYVRLKKKHGSEHQPHPAVTIGRSGPIRLELSFPPNDLRIWNTNELDKAVRPLLEKEWSLVSDWDIPLSIRATICNGGVPTFHRRRRKMAPQYILLIEEKSPRDHLAGLYADLGLELRRRDMAVEWFFYDTTPYRCWRDRREPSSFTNVDRLAAEYDGAKLLIVGDPNGLLALPELKPSNRTLDLLDGFREVALLCNKSTAQWTSAELALCQLFPVVPASAAGLATLIAQWDAPSVWTPDYWKIVHPEISVPSVEGAMSDDEEDIEELIDNLRFYMGKTGFVWLCAAAVYPEIYYELTTLLNDESIMPDARLTEVEQNRVWFNALLRLSRIRWFRDGVMPNSVRQHLRAALPPQQAQEVRRQLLEILDLDVNQPPVNSYAAANRTYTMSWYMHERQILDPSVSDAERARLDSDFYQKNANVQVSDIEDAIGRSYYLNLQPSYEQSQSFDNQYQQQTSQSETPPHFESSASSENVAFTSELRKRTETILRHLANRELSEPFEAVIKATKIKTFTEGYEELYEAERKRPLKKGMNRKQMVLNGMLQSFIEVMERVEMVSADYPSVLADFEVQYLKSGKKEDDDKIEDFEELKRTVRNLISEGKTNKAIDVAIKWANEHGNTNMQETLVQQKALLSNLERQENLGLISFSEGSQTRAQVNYSFLELMDHFEDKNDPKESPVTQKNQDIPTDDRSKFIEHVRQYIADGSTNRAIALMQERVSQFGESFVEEVNLLESRFSYAQSERIKGLVTNEDHSRSLAQINYALLNILEKIEQSGSKKDKNDKDKKNGNLLFNLPDTMTLGKDYRCIVRIGHNEEVILHDFNKDDNTVIKNIRISDVMKVELVDYGETPAFAIRHITENDQFIAEDDFTEWIIMIKPLAIGEYSTITLRVSLIEIIDGKERNKDIVLEQSIKVIEPDDDRRKGYTTKA